MSYDRQSVNDFVKTLGFYFYFLSITLYWLWLLLGYRDCWQSYMHVQTTLCPYVADMGPFYNCRSTTWVEGGIPLATWNGVARCSMKWLPRVADRATIYRTAKDTFSLPCDKRVLLLWVVQWSFVTSGLSIYFFTWKKTAQNWDYW